MSVYEFTVKDNKGNNVSLSEFKGKLLLIVNTATKCGLTPQYEGLESLYEKYKDQGFEILDFPCNQFGEQAPGDDEGIHSFCTGRFGITFPQFSKIDVNGENAIPLYMWITENTKFDGFNGPAGIAMSAMLKTIDKDYKKNGKIKWNFTKILIDREGNLAGRFEPTLDMKKVRAKIEEVL